MSSADRPGSLLWGPASPFAAGVVATVVVVLVSSLLPVRSPASPSVRVVVVVVSDGAGVVAVAGAEGSGDLAAPELPLEPPHARSGAAATESAIEANT